MSNEPELPKPNLEDLILPKHTCIQDDLDLSTYPPDQKINCWKVKKLCGIPRKELVPSMYPDEVKELRKTYRKTGIVPWYIEAEARKNIQVTRIIFTKDIRQEFEKFNHLYNEAFDKMEPFEFFSDKNLLNFLRYNFWNYILNNNRYFKIYNNSMKKWVTRTFCNNGQTIDFTQCGQHHSMWMDHLTQILPKKYRISMPSHTLYYLSINFNE